MNDYLLDTDTISAHLRGNPSVTTRLMAARGCLHSSVICLAEISSWIDRRNTPRMIRDGFTALIPDIGWEPVTFHIARNCGRLRATAYDAGGPLPLFDLIIAATALELGCIVVTHNTRHFTGIPGLIIEDWTVP